MPHTLTAHVPDRDPGEDVDGDEPDWPLYEEVCELRPGVRFSCQVSRCGREGGREGERERGREGGRGELSVECEAERCSQL